MNRVAQFECKLLESKRTYRGGDFLTGVVIVEFTEVTKIRGIDLRFLGQAVVQWSVTSRSKNDSRRVIRKTFKNKETYFDQTVVLFGRGEDDPGDNVDHPAGVRRYPFRFELPPELPATFDGAHGAVTYAVHGMLDIPWAPDRSFRQKFKVMPKLDLNDVPQAKDALMGRDEKFLCCLCCRHGPIAVEFSIPRAGYVPGQTIYFDAKVTNHSRRTILRTEVKLKQFVRFKSSTTNTKVTTKDLAAIVYEDDINKGGHFQWDKEAIIVPQCPPSYLPYCRIIDVKYELVFNIDVAGTAIDMEMPLQLIIGTVPLTSQEVTLDDPPLETLSCNRSSAENLVVTSQPTLRESPFTMESFMSDRPENERALHDVGDRISLPRQDSATSELPEPVT